MGIREWETRLEAAAPGMLAELARAEAAAGAAGSGSRVGGGTGMAVQAVSVVGVAPVSGLSAAPGPYQEVLRLLRAIDHSGQWPVESPGLPAIFLLHTCPTLALLAPVACHLSHSANLGLLPHHVPF